MGHRGHQQHDWSTVEDDGWKVDSGQTRSSSGPHSNPSQGRGPEHNSLKNYCFHAVCFPQEVAVVRQTPSGQITTIMLASAHPCLHAVPPAMCGSSFLALRCFPPCPFPSVSTFWWIGPRQERYLRQQTVLVNSDNKMRWLCCEK